MKEPSILDYLKSRIDPKKHGEIELSPAPGPLPGTGSAANTPAPAPTDSIHPQPAPVSESFPWRVILALTLALAAQRGLEPPRNDPAASAWMAVLLFGMSLGLAAWAWQRGELNLSAPTRPVHKIDPLTVRGWAAFLTVLLMLAAFFFLGRNPLTDWDNRFTPVNLILWLGVIIFFVAAFWLGGLAPGARWLRLRAHLADPTVWRWAGMVVVAFAVAVAFRTFNLGGVLAEPFSDHAEKLFDVADVLNGQTAIFFVRNTGREFFQMYLTAWVAQTFGTGLSFMSLKIGTVLCGILTLPYIYLIGREYGGHRVALFALLLAGMAYWPNIISRVGLRYPLYALFAAPALYHLLRGLRASNRNDFILSGLFLGLGLHGYSSFRFMPVVIVIAMGVYILHARWQAQRAQSLWWLLLITMSAVVVFLPLLRYLLDYPDQVAYRAFTRLTGAESPLPGPAVQIFLQNFWNSLTMFQWNNGEIWVHSIPGRPALDVVSGALLVLGSALVLLRYIRRRDWRDLFLLLAVPLLTMPSTLSLAFPNENPSLNRSGGAIIPVFVLAALALDAVVTGVGLGLARRRAQAAGWGLALVLLAWSGMQNFDLVFNQFDQQYRQGVWNSSEMAQVVQEFERSTGSVETVWIVPYPYWVDTRLLGIQSGHFERNFTLWPEEIAATINVPGPKLFLAYPDDTQTVNILQLAYPQGVLQVYPSDTYGHDFLIFNVPAP